MNEIEIVVTSQDKSGLDKAAAKAKRSGQEIGDGIQKGFKDGEQAGDKASSSIKSNLDKVEKSGKEAGDGLRESLGGAFDGLSEMIGGESGDIVGKLAGSLTGGAGVFLGAGAAIGTAIFAGLSAEWKEDAVGGLLAAQAGAASSAAEGLGNEAGAVFADNFGDSIEEVGEAMKAVFENKLISTDADQGAVQALTEKVMTLSKITGESFDAISYAAARMVKTDIAGSVTEAFDLIGQAQEDGLNASGDLLDTLTEYSTKFRDLGLNGAEALGLIKQQMDAGARNTDIAADALKEFAIRAQDSSLSTRRGFETIGLDADKMGKMVAAGGSQAREALGATLDALRAMPPGVARSTAAVDLFGTKAEDLGAALYNMNLDKATKEFGDFAGSVDDMAKKVSASTSLWDKLGRGISTVVSNIGEFVDQDFSEMLDDMPELKGMLDEINKAQNEFDATGSTKGLDELKKKYPEATDKINDYIKKKRDEKEATEGTRGASLEYIATLDQLIDKYSQVHDAAVGQENASLDWIDAMKAADEAIKDNGKNTDIYTEKGENNYRTLLKLSDAAWANVESMSANSASVQEVQTYMGGAREKFIATAEAMGYSADEANAMADKLRLIPGDYTARAYADTVTAEKNVRNFLALLNSIPRTIYTNANLAITQAVHTVTGHASGGIVGAELPWGAATGGQRHSSTVIDEAGPELVELPTGSRVATAGATRAMGEAGWLGGGPATVVAEFVIGSPTDELGEAIANWLRKYVKNRYGGSVSGAFGQRGSA